MAVDGSREPAVMGQTEGGELVKSIYSTKGEESSGAQTVRSG